MALTIPARIAIGIVIDRYEPRLTFSALLVFAIVPCLLGATAHDFHQLVWSSLINRIVGSGFVAGVRMVAEWFPPKEIGLAQGIYGGWGNFGAAASGFCLPLLAVTSAYFTGGTLNWRMAIATIGMRQTALLNFSYLTNSGSQITVLLILPTWFEQTFELNPVAASLVATAYPVLNLVFRPSGGLISDRTGSRKWTMTGLTSGIGIGYLLIE